MSNFKASDGCEIFYDVKGTGEPLVFVHGWSANSDIFAHQVEHFSKSYRVIVYDLRGHGRSDRRSKITERNMTMERNAADLLELLDHLEIDKAHVCGWSMGTSILLCFIKLFKTSRLLTAGFIDMTPRLLNDESWDMGDFDALGNLEFARLIATDWETAYTQALPELFARNRDKMDENVIAVREMMKNNIPHVMSSMWMAMALGDYRDVLPTIDVPVFLPYSNGGDMYNRRHGEYMHENIKKSTLIIFEDCGHSLFIEDPVKFNTEYGDFLKQK